MSLERAIQLHTAALVILGAVFVGHRQDAMLAPALAAVAAVTAVAVTDVLGWVRLTWWVANLVAVVLVGWSLREFLDIASDEKLVAIANMLCYLQIVLLFQVKSQRVYWQLLVLSILQVVVGAALDVGPQFGFMLIVYALAALSTLFLLCVYREVRAPSRGAAVATPPAGTTADLLMLPPHVAPPEVSEEQLRRVLPTKILVRQVLLLAAATLLFAVVFFYATPRWNDSSWLGARSRGSASGGFQPEVRLEERGRIHLSNQVVMRVSLSRMLDRRPVTLIGEPYFFGEALTEYRHDERGGRWLPRRLSVNSFPSQGSRRGIVESAPQSSRNMVRQDIVLEGTAGSRRFEIVPSQPLSDYAIGTFGRPPRGESEGNATPRHRKYSVSTPAILGGRQLHAIPHPNRLLTLGDGIALDEEEQQATALDPQRFPTLAETAASVIAQQGVENATAVDKALALERHFLSPEAYSFSLNLNFSRDEALDPIEDFVGNHRTGHCEYFASALVLMLRSQGIPARMIWGYKGGAFNSVGNYYVVQQRHAHAWVEAWVQTAELPPGELAGPPSDGGAWYRLDPTPGGELYLASDDVSLGTRAAQAFDYVELMWRDYVLSLNRNRQDDLVYGPMTTTAALLPSWVESRRIQRWLGQLSAEMGLDFAQGRQRGGRRAFEASLALVVMAVLLGLAASIYVARAGASMVGRWLLGNRRSVSSSAPAFYRRLERVLARLPAVRGEGETPRELAAAAGAKLEERWGPDEITMAPAQIVAAYYRVRFGGDRLDKVEIEGIEQSLNELAHAVKHRNSSFSS